MFYCLFPVTSSRAASSKKNARKDCQNFSKHSYNLQSVEKHELSTFGFGRGPPAKNHGIAGLTRSQIAATEPDLLQNNMAWKVGINTPSEKARKSFLLGRGRLSGLCHTMP